MMIAPSFAQMVRTSACVVFVYFCFLSHAYLMDNHSGGIGLTEMTVAHPGATTSSQNIYGYSIGTPSQLSLYTRVAWNFIQGSNPWNGAKNARPRP